MAKYEVQVLAAAYSDLEEIFTYILADDPSAAERVLQRLMTALHRLETFPFMGTLVRDRVLVRHKFRVVVVDPYLVFYRVVESTVVIYRVLHCRRDYALLFGTDQQNHE